jgi:tetratricopeptide (TPR) repeat protein
MSSASNSNSSSNWTSSNVLNQAAICLVLGVVLGFFIRGSRTAASTPVTAGTAQPAAGAIAGVGQVTPDQLNHMAEKQAQPLLAQLQSTPNDAELLAKVGYIYYAARNFKPASEYYKRSVDIKDDLVVRTELGRAYYHAGDPDSALAEFENIVKIDPNNATAMYNIGLIKWQHNFGSERESGELANWRGFELSTPPAMSDQNLEPSVFEWHTDGGNLPAIVEPLKGACSDWQELAWGAGSQLSC